VRALIGMVLAVMSLAAEARALSPEEVPQPLRPWVQWALFDHPDRSCPIAYNRADRVCSWESRLSLNVQQTKGTFVQDLSLFAEAWGALPGDETHWPQDVRVDGVAAAVGLHDGRPALRLKPGQHRIEGTFSWRQPPESLLVPADAALITLEVLGEVVPAPVVSAQGQVWLRSREAPKAGAPPEARLDVKVFRRLIDDNPLQLVTRIELAVAGPEREVALTGALGAGFVPLRLESPLPARVESDGRLRVQVRPGRWTLSLRARHPAYLTEISPPSAEPPWPAEEVWVFEAHPDLRLVKIEGVAEIDPAQTSLPADWQRLPAYRVRPGDTLRLNVQRRGDPQPAPDRLELDRTVWLDFDGGGYTLRDRLSGTLTHDWRLSSSPALALGRVLLDGKPQLITRLSGASAEGVEVRRGRLNLVADARVERRSSVLPAVGWGRDFQRVKTALNLPPGWELFAVTGAERASGGWLQRWTLLDLFLVLVVAIGAGRLWGWPWALLALATLGLTWHQPGAPQWGWINLLAAVALLRVLPEGRFHGLARWYRNLSLLGLVIIGVPFLVNQVRVGIYPQLEQPEWTVQPETQASAPVAAAPTADALMSRSFAEKKGVGGARFMAKPAGPAAPPPRPALDEIDPNAQIQTGPGLPDWQWRRVEIGWNGPVEQGETLRIYLISPAVRLMLNLLGAGLVLALAWRLWRGGGAAPRTRGGAAAAALILGAGVLLGPGAVPEARAAEYPPSELLQRLEQRLTEPPDCLPACAQIARMSLTADRGGLLLRLEVHAEQSVAVPLPVATGEWLPGMVSVDGTPAVALRRGAEGQLWLKVDPGVHEVALAAELPAAERISIPLPLPPRSLDVKVHGWTLLGLDPTGHASGQLQLERQGSAQGAASAAPALQPQALPAFVRIERTLHLGLDWRVETRVQRLAPARGSVLLRYPLLPGESVTTAGIQVEGGQVLINLGDGQDRFAWDSSLQKAAEIDLIAADNRHWTEVWRLDASPIWHLALAGIPVVHHQDRAQRWLPEWRPWPGETVSIRVTRPEGVPGATLTVDSSRLSVSPGQRATDVELELALRSSKGGQHSVQLPEGARLHSVSIDGRTQPIRQSGRSVTLPLTPGSQRVALDWQEARGMTWVFHTPRADLAAPSVNASIHLEPGQDRWILLAGGPALGPAVLFWGVLLVLVMLAYGLGRINLTPLRAWHWLLLGIGLSQSEVWVGALVVGWLMALGLRCRQSTGISRGRFNWTQIGLGLLTLAALWLLFAAVQQGLLGLPQMQVAGNQSDAFSLNWYQDRAAALLPGAWVLSVPLYWYRVAMLVWSLWLAFALLGWLRWGWRCYSRDGLWRAIPLELRKGYRKRHAAEASAPAPEGGERAV